MNNRVKLAKHFTVYNYARRGRGDSGDTLPYAVERELEDIAALVASAGGQGTPLRSVVGWCAGARSRYGRRCGRQARSLRSAI